MAVEWQILDRGQVRSGLSSDQLRSLAGNGTLAPSTPIRRLTAGDKTSDWARAGEVKGLFADDVTKLLGGAICVRCGARLVDGLSCPTCSVPPKPRATPTEIVVTTTDLHAPYEIIGPVYFQISNKGMGQFLNYLTKHKALLAGMRAKQQVDAPPKPDWGFLIGEWSVGQGDFDIAFFIAVQELKQRAAMIGGNAIVGMRQDIDLDSTGWQYFYLQMYGTAVRLL